jgi:hypothetical protein
LADILADNLADLTANLAVEFIKTGQPETTSIPNQKLEFRQLEEMPL